MHTYMPMTNLIEIFMGKMSTVYITIKVLFQPEFPIDHFLSLWFPLLHILYHIISCSFPWVFSVLRGQIVEVKRKPDLLGRAVSATYCTHCAKFNLKILRITNCLEQAKIRPIALCNVQICLVANSTAKQVFENKILYAYLCLVYFIYIFYMNIVLFDKSIPSVSEIQEKYDRMTIFKWTHCPVRLLFDFVLS